MIQLLIAYTIRLCLWLRYDIKVIGLEKVKGKRGVLLLPNHPGELDPVILGTQLWRDFAPHPVVIEDFFNMPSLKWLMNLIGAQPMPNMEGGLGSYKRLRVQRALEHIKSLLDQGENILIYPAGRLMRSGLEDLRAASAVYDILRQDPDIPIVLIRTRGLIGSSFSWVAHQARPPLGQSLLNGAKYVLLNLIFFTPRRKVTVELDMPGEDFPGARDKQELNRWLEAWYNKHGEEESSLVSFSRWHKLHFELVSPDRENAIADIDVPDDVREKVITELARMSGKEPGDITDHANLARDLGLDSLNTADLASWIDEVFLVSDVDNTDLLAVADVLAAATGAVKRKPQTISERIRKGWDESNRPLPQLPELEKTIIWNFLNTADRMGSAPAFADESRGVLSYKKAKIAVVLLANLIKNVPGERVGIMLPASTGTNLVVLATMLAGKVPVMINWTVGDASMEHVIRSSELKAILSVGRFLDRVELNVDLLEPYLQTLETLAADVGFADKLGAVLQARKKADRLIQDFPVNPDIESPAVILFTSGSESVPKGVPLTHRNILSNIRGSLEAVVFDVQDKLQADSAIYGFLPPFHSFGFTVTTILPAVSGIKAAYYPNPTETRKVVRGIELWRPAIMCGTPTFLASIFAAAAKEQLTSLRLFLAGAEKTPDDLFSVVADNSSAEILEGYGITECSPVLTINRSGQPRAGVGKAVGDVEIKIVDIDSHAELPLGERGLIVVRGSSIFGGYLGAGAKSPFLDINGTSYYNTGDLGFLDEKGSLTLAGRLKRFVKVGGEMISLPAMEAALHAAYPGEDGPTTAIAYVEPEGERPVLALFSTVDVTEAEANQTVKAAGFSNLARIHKVLRIEEIPLLGTGKTDYRELTKRLEAELASDG